MSAFRSLDMPARLIASVDDVDVWSASLRPAGKQVDLLAGKLSEDECVRAERFVSTRDRTRFIAGRGALRMVLSGYLGCDPRSVPFRYSLDGRPDLADYTNDRGLRFNVSHSVDLTLIAVSRERRIGIDLERIRPVPEVETIVRDQFTPSEQEVWTSLPEHQKLHAFFCGWTRKEAWLKAIGVGLAGSLRRVEVTLSPTGPARLLRIDLDGENADHWSFVALPSIDGHASALAVEGGCFSLGERRTNIRQRGHPAVPGQSGGRSADERRGPA
jgi:4'-phosphopantetheinyl transferase